MTKTLEHVNSYGENYESTAVMASEIKGMCTVSLCTVTICCGVFLKKKKKEVVNISILPCYCVAMIFTITGDYQQLNV